MIITNSHIATSVIKPKNIGTINCNLEPVSFCFLRDSFNETTKPINPNKNQKTAYGVLTD